MTGPLLDLSGIWTVREESADTTKAISRTRREVWRLRQAGGTVTGTRYVAFEQALTNGDSFTCSGQATTATAYETEINGTVEQANVELREVGPLKNRGPCCKMEEGGRRYRASMSPSGLLLENLSEKQDQLLLSRTAPSAVDLSDSVIEGPGDVPQKLHGIWNWENESKEEGTEIREKEEWHLVQIGDRLVGHYDQYAETHLAKGELHECNGRRQRRRAVRMDVTGRIVCGSVELVETGHRLLETSACDDGKRIHRRYSGHLDHETKLRLFYEGGHQVLTRGEVNRRASPQQPYPAVELDQAFDEGLVALTITAVEKGKRLRVTFSSTITEPMAVLLAPGAFAFGPESHRVSFTINEPSRFELQPGGSPVLIEFAQLGNRRMTGGTLTMHTDPSSDGIVTKFDAVEFSFGSGGS